MKRGVKIFRTDPTMTNIRELIEAVIARMYQYGEVVPEVENFATHESTTATVVADWNVFLDVRKHEKP
jgi:hypothetical protein